MLPMLSRANSQGSRGLRTGGLRIGPRDFATISRPRTPSVSAFVGRFTTCTKHTPKRTPREFRGPFFEAVPGPAQFQ
eukprot:15478270-Alexandrium_andersonii.AAC.1